MPKSRKTTSRSKQPKQQRRSRKTISRWVWVLLIVIAFAAAAANLIRNRTASDEVAAPLQSQKLGTATLEMPNGEKIEVEVARTEQEREIGLMNRTSIPMNSGMLFVFASESQHTFWMKNTLVDLDMIFIGADKKVTSISERVPRTTPQTPEEQIPRRFGTGQYVLELAAGGAKHYSIQDGAPLVFEVTPKSLSQPNGGNNQ